MRAVKFGILHFRSMPFMEVVVLGEVPHSSEEGELSDRDSRRDERMW